MAGVIQFLRRINGAAGAPSAVGRLEGEMFVNFPGAAGTAGAPALYCFDGVGWRSFNTSVVYADAAEVLAGTEVAKSISPAGLQSRTLLVPSGTPANDAGYLPRLNASGKIDPGFYEVGSSIRFLTAANLAAAPSPPVGGFILGDFLIHNGAANATVHASYTGAAGDKVDPDDQMIYDGAAWRVMKGAIATANFLTTANFVTTFVTASAGADADDLGIAIGDSLAAVPAGVDQVTLGNQVLAVLLAASDATVLTTDDTDAMETALGSIGYLLASATGPTAIGFFEDTDNGTNKIWLQGQTTLGADFTLTLPARSGELGLSVLGRQSIYVNAAAMVPRTSNGATRGSFETATNKVMLDTIDFANGADSFAQFGIVMPKSWNKGTLTAKFHWAHESTTTNFDITLGIQAVAIGNDDTLDVAFGTGVVVTDAGGTTRDFYTTPETSAFTVAGSPGDEELVQFQIYRDDDGAGTAGNDDLAVAARLIGVTIYYTRAAETDA